MTINLHDIIIQPTLWAAIVKIFDILEKLLPSDELGIMQNLGLLADKSDLRLYLVGGAIRDLFLGMVPEDLDFVLEGNSSDFSRMVAHEFGGHVVSESQFSTSKVRLGNADLDFAMARNEYYSKPGALPTVTQGNIEQDLGRRDFTVNAMALPIYKWGRLDVIDPFGGKQDIENHCIKVLHEYSFVDDATRMMRAVRYEQRLRFVIEEKTEHMLRRDLPMLKTISGDRIRSEFRKWIKEHDSVGLIGRASDLGITQVIDYGLNKSVGILKDLRLDFGSVEFDEKLHFAVLTYFMNQDEGESFINKLKLPPSYARVVRDSIQLRHYSSNSFDARWTPYQMNNVLNLFSAHAIKACIFINGRNYTFSQHLLYYLDHARNLKPYLNGKDLIALGIDNGPIIGQILSALRDAHLEGLITDRSHELVMVENWLKTS